MPVLPSKERPETEPWDAETKLLQATSAHDTQQKNNVSEHLRTDQNTQPLPIPASRLRHASISKRVVLRASRATANNSVSPELAEIIRRREQIANQETELLHAATLPIGQEKGEASCAAKAAQGEAKQKRALRRKSRIPVLQQISMVECGAACLAMLLSYYGRKTTISEIREQCGIGRDGLSALGIVKAARKYAMRVKAVSLEENDFRFVTLPSIVHWEFNHFIVFERWSPRFVEAVDPASGRKRMTA
ncbi:MAG: hypothetical protein JO215_01880, partial [Ktedonobacteraceae bacterium]|nr:hypothetical protein [Ktedonobacteraceae bacterium]